MIENYDFLIYSEGTLEGYYSRGYLVEVLADYLPASKILWVERPISPVVSPLTQRVRFKKWILGDGNLRKVKENLFVCRLVVYMHDHLASILPLVPMWNHALLSRQMEKVVSKLGLRKNNLISWIYDPFQLEYLGLVDEKLSIWESQHDYRTLPGIPCIRTKKQIMDRELRILRQVDIVFVNSNTQIASKCDYHNNIHVMPEATPKIYIDAIAKGSFVAEDVVNIPAPIVGLIGYLTPRINLQLLIYLATAHPEWSLVWVGITPEAEKKFSKSPEFLTLKRLDNVHMLPARPMLDLPFCLKAFDVCIVPFVLDEWNRGCSPSKLYMYLSTGQPIVSVDIIEMEAFRDIVMIARNYEEFEQYVVKALQGNNAELRKKRIKLAYENSCETRVKQMISVIEETISKRV